jgi:predicted  nucleic acid-binding Zn-ribbon protein
LTLETSNSNLEQNVADYENKAGKMRTKLRSQKDLDITINNLDSENEGYKARIRHLEKELENALDALVKQKYHEDQEVKHLENELLAMSKQLEKNQGLAQ